MRRLLAILGALCLTLPAASAERVVQPRNPALGAGLSLIAESGLAAIDLDSGKTRWRIGQGEHLLAPTVADGIAFAGSSDGLLAIDTADGSLRWRRLTGKTVFSPLLVGDVLYAGSTEGTLFAIEPHSGRTLWQRQFPGWVYSPAWSGGLLVTGGSEQTLWALSPDDGSLHWQAELDQELVFRPIAVPGGTVASTFAGTVSHYDDDGRLQWRQSDGVAAITPLLIDHRLLLAGMDGSVRVRDLERGRLLAETRLGNRIVLAPVAGADRALLVSESGQAGIYSLAKLRWLKRFVLPAGSGKALPVVAADQFLMMDPKRSGKDVFRLLGSATDPGRSLASQEDSK